MVQYVWIVIISIFSISTLDIPIDIISLMVSILSLFDLDFIGGGNMGFKAFLRKAISGTFEMILVNVPSMMFY